MKKIKFFEYFLDTGNVNDFAYKILQNENNRLNEEYSNIVSFLNPHSFVEAEKKNIFKEALLNSKYLFVDGVGIKLLSSKRPKRIIGYDFFLSILNEINNNYKYKKIYFLGSQERVLTKIVERLEKDFPSINISGVYQPSFVKLEFEDEEIKLINNDLKKKNPDVVFVGLSAPKQEILSYRLSKFNKNIVFVNIGAVFDYYSRNKPMPNKFLRNFGLEWIFRLITDYHRIKYRIYSSTFLYLETILKKRLFHETYNSSQNFLMINNLDSLPLLKKDTVLVAFNLAFLAYYSKNIINHHKKIVLWPDGITTKLFVKNIDKIPGYKLIDNINFESFNKIIVVGNLENSEKNYLKKKTEKKIIFLKLPFFNMESTDKIQLDTSIIDKDDIILITLPTPKQEIIANLLKEKINDIYIVCIGGGLSIASGRIPRCPKILDNLGLEFLWRLQDDTYRRIKRISVSILYAAKYFLLSRKKIKFSLIEKL